MRLVYAWFFPANPAGDEAYYWDWGRRLDYGYFSKPPFIAWLYAFVDWAGQSTVFGIRATAAVLGALTLLVVFRLATELFDSETGFAVTLIALATPANSAVSFLLTIDAPLMFFWASALLLTWRYADNRTPVLSLSLLCLALGLGHLTKQMMMVFPVLAILFLALGKETRGVLVRPGWWIATLGSYLFLAPPLIWNARNEWITFQHTTHHFASGSQGGNFFVERAADFGEYLATQAMVLSPVIAVVIACLTLSGLTRLRRSSRQVRFLLVFSAIPLAFMLLLALRQKMLPNWPAVFYIAASILAAAWFCRKIDLPAPPVSWRKSLRPGLAIGFSLVFLFYAGPVVFPLIGKPGYYLDFNRRLLGHDKLGAGFDEIRSQVPGGEEDFIVALNHRDLASHLAFHLEGQPRVYRYTARGIESQYEMWPNPVEDGLTGRNALILHASTRLPAPLRDAFRQIEVAGEFEVEYRFDRTRRFFVLRGIDLQSWPPLALPDPEHP